VSLSRFKQINRRLPALKARRMLAQGNALGFGINRTLGALKGRRIAPLFQGGQDGLGRYPRGIAPG